MPKGCEWTPKGATSMLERATRMTDKSWIKVCWAVRGGRQTMGRRTKANDVCPRATLKAMALGWAAPPGDDAKWLKTRHNFEIGRSAIMRSGHSNSMGQLSALRLQTVVCVRIWPICGQIWTISARVLPNSARLRGNVTPNGSANRRPPHSQTDNLVAPPIRPAV